MVQRKELIRIADLDVGSQEKSSYQAESEYKESVRRYGYSDRRTRIKRSEWENAEIERREAYNKRYMNEHGADWIERKMSKLELDKSHLSVGLTTRTENWFEKLSAYDPSFREYLESIDKMTQLLGIRNLIENDTQEIPAVNEAENRGPDIPIQDSAQVSRWSDFSSNSYTVPDFDCNVDQDYQTTEVQNRFSAGDLATGQEVNGLLFPSTDDQSSPTLDRDSSYHSSQSDRRSISGVRHLHENRSSSTDDSIRFMAAHPTATNVNTNAESEDPMNIQESIKSKLSRALNKIPKKLNTSLVIG
ncbi:uncharacterized protein L201_005190 [Kwoniella dendrophila CBS 6074]|uniref:BZIP domain-containing protein n=1 Tax=Kwoniella dendrophila CBS 6074 TaxID=1295534 RepID=A0AAX4JY28_9TREE